MPRLRPPLGTIGTATIPCPIEVSGESRSRARRPCRGPFRRGATCVDEPLNIVPYAQVYPEFAPQLSVAEPRQCDCTKASHARGLPRQWGRGSNGFAACSSRRVPDDFTADREVRRRRGSQGEGTRFRPRPRSRANRSTRVTRCARRSCPRSGSRSSTARPDGRRSEQGSRHRIAMVDPGGCCGSRGTTKRRQGPPRACVRSLCFGRKPAGRDRDARAARRRRREPFNRFGRRPPDASCISGQSPRRSATSCARMRAFPPRSAERSVSTPWGVHSCP
jgi:hypothetical protein